MLLLILEQLHQDLSLRILWLNRQENLELQLSTGEMLHLMVQNGILEDWKFTIFLLLVMRIIQNFFQKHMKWLESAF